MPWTDSTLSQAAMLIVGIGVAGPGLVTLTGDRLYRILAAPAIVLIGMAFLVQALRGPRAGWLARSTRWAPMGLCGLLDVRSRLAALLRLEPWAGHAAWLIHSGNVT